MTTTDDSMARYTKSETATFTFIGRAESDTAADLLDKVEEQGSFDVVSDLAYPLPVAVIGVAGAACALTLGNVILHTGDTLDAQCLTYTHRAGICEEPSILLADHERAHVFQYMTLGPLFLPLYFLCGGISVRNRFERAADRYAHGSGSWWPW